MLGTITAAGGPLAFDGDGPALRELAEFYARHLAERSDDPDALTGEDLLRFMAGRMNGRTWAEVVSNEAAAAAN